MTTTTNSIYNYIEGRVWWGGGKLNLTNYNTCNWNWQLYITVHCWSNNTFVIPWLACSCELWVPQWHMISWCIPWLYELQLRWPNKHIPQCMWRGHWDMQSWWWPRASQPFPFTCMYCKQSQWRVILTRLNCISVPPSLWNVPLQNVIVGLATITSSVAGHI